ncbi:uncharacterized protein LOC123012950 [Tribolium madens]|uniref:uncharacterized protein LOC123012950 n=1 Tax=Tribolium madens TaxID=41895 RepID=UPI001CF72A87|nr:uncharacterized protein LOC123012950 [Tribolium madens]
MNFESPNPDFTKDVTMDSTRNGLQNKFNGFYSRSRPQFQDCSPLLRTAYSHNPQRRSNSQNSSNNQYNKPVYNRLGQCNNSYKSSSISKDAQKDDNSNSKRMYNRKRPSDGGVGSSGSKRKWNKRTPYYQNSTNNQHNLAQSRMDRIRNNSVQEDEIVIHNEVSGTTSNFNDTQDIDATDITVEVINSAAQVRDEEDQIQKFKMILDPKTQAAIKTIQQKRKDKQVIFPFPVTPNVTGITLHERFTTL